jgi:hypothetical protein
MGSYAQRSGFDLLFFRRRMVFSRLSPKREFRRENRLPLRPYDRDRQCTGLFWIARGIDQTEFVAGVPVGQAIGPNLSPSSRLEMWPHEPDTRPGSRSRAKAAVDTDMASNHKAVLEIQLYKDMATCITYIVLAPAIQRHSPRPCGHRR